MRSTMQQIPVLSKEIIRTHREKLIRERDTANRYLREQHGRIDRSSAEVLAGPEAMRRRRQPSTPMCVAGGASRRPPERPRSGAPIESFTNCRWRGTILRSRASSTVGQCVPNEPFTVIRVLRDASALEAAYLIGYASALETLARLAETTVSATCVSRRSGRRRRCCGLSNVRADRRRLSVSRLQLLRLAGGEQSGRGMPGTPSPALDLDVAVCGSRRRGWTTSSAGANRLCLRDQSGIGPCPSSVIAMRTWPAFRPIRVPAAGRPR